MTTLWDAIKEGARQAMCSIMSTGYDSYRLLKNISSLDPLGSGPWSGSVNLRFCNRPEAATPPPPPFVGGQCPVLYNVTGTYTEANNNAGGCGVTKSWNAQLTGPGFTLSEVSGVTLVNAAGQTTTVTAEGAAFQGIPIVDGCVSGLGGFPFALRGTATIVSVSRVDGQPDNCGSLPPVLPPPTPGWNQREISLDYTNNAGTLVTVPATFIFGQLKVDVDANIKIPITVDVGGITVNLNFNLTTGDISLFPTNNYYGDRRKGTKPTDVAPPPEEDIPDYPDSLPLPAPPTGEEEEEEEGLIVGALVTTTSIQNGKLSTLFQGDNPDIKIPNLGHISFLCRVGFTQSAWTADIPVKNIRQVIECPWQPGAFKVTGTPQPGVEWVITPLFSKKELPVFSPVEA